MVVDDVDVEGVVHVDAEDVVVNDVGVEAVVVSNVDVEEVVVLDAEDEVAEDVDVEHALGDDADAEDVVAGGVYVGGCGSRRR